MRTHSNNNRVLNLVSKINESTRLEQVHKHRTKLDLLVQLAHSRLFLNNREQKKMRKENWESVVKQCEIG